MKANKTDPLTKILREILKSQQKAPRRMTIPQYFQKIYYSSRMKAIVDTRYAEAVHVAALKGAPVPKRLSVQNAVAKDLLNAESEEFRNELKELCEAEYQEEYTLWKAGWQGGAEDGDGSEFTAEEYDR